MNAVKIQRHDQSDDNSLRAWSAADELLLNTFDSLDKKPTQLGLYHDRFGFLGCQLHDHEPTIIISNKSQERAIELNLKANQLAPLSHNFPLDQLENPFDLVLLKAPKSLGLFELNLDHIVNNSSEDVVVLCGFMTRHFTPKLLEIAGKYFEGIEQSKAVKKARLLTLTKKKKVDKNELKTTLEYNNQGYQQYLGVFSADHIDYATQFFLEHIDLKPTDQTILDLASGNGIIGSELLKKNKEAEIHLLDDSYLAHESSKLNISGNNVHQHFDDNLDKFEDEQFDLIVTNPPFHFEYEVNINIPLGLFKQSHRILKKNGTLQIVSSQHLNYKTHLSKIFSIVEIVAEDKKFVVYKCIK